MLLAIKLLVVLGVLSYAVSAVLAEQSIGAAFQAPISRIISRYAAERHEDFLTLSTVRTASAMYSKKPALLSPSRHFQPHPRRPAFAEQLIDNTTMIITTVDGLRVRHGEASWWGDLNHVETRFVYHQLLPKQLLQLAKERDDVSVEDLARAASMARHAARLYARERSSLPLRLLAGLYDGFRHLKNHGRWSWTGMTYEELWAKYERKILEEVGGHIDSAELNRRVALRILQKSCQTNPRFDRLGNIERAQDILERAAQAAEQRQRQRRQHKFKVSLRRAVQQQQQQHTLDLAVKELEAQQQQQQLLQPPVMPTFETVASGEGQSLARVRLPSGHLGGMLAYFGKLTKHSELI